MEYSREFDETEVSPEQLSEILANLKPDHPEQAGTLKYTSPSFPNLYIRTNEPKATRQDSLAEIRNDYQSYYDLEGSGCDVTPFTVYQRDSRLVIIARKVDGVPLKDVVVKNADILEQYDVMTAKQFNQIFEQRGKGATQPADTTGPGQYMYGKLAGTEVSPSIHYVDIDASGFMFTNSSLDANDAVHADTLADLALKVISTENELGIATPRSKHAIYNEILHALVQGSVDPHAERQMRLTLKAIEQNDPDVLEEYMG